MALLTILLVCLCAVCYASDFSGTWKLDKANSESPYELLSAMGMASSRRSIASRLEITEIYVVTATSISMRRVTAYTDDAETHSFGMTTNKHDSLLGDGTQLTTLRNDKLIYHFVRNDGAIYHSVKEMLPNDSNTMRVIMTFTLAGGSSNTPIVCVRLFKRSLQ